MSEQPSSVASLVRSAADGDALAWNSLVEQFSPYLWSVVRGYRLTREESADVFQQTWLRLVEHLGKISDPAHLRPWLATTARREALRILRRRSAPVDPHLVPDIEDRDVSPEDAFLALEREQALGPALRHAIDQLPVRCQKLLALLYGEPPPSYADIAAAIGAPIGSIGPIRQRCLQRLRELLGPYLETEDVDLAPAIRSGVESSQPVPDEAVSRVQRTFVERQCGDEDGGAAGAAGQVVP